MSTGRTTYKLPWAYQTDDKVEPCKSLILCDLCVLLWLNCLSPSSVQQTDNGDRKPVAGDTNVELVFPSCSKLQPESRPGSPLAFVQNLAGMCDHAVTDDVQSRLLLPAVSENLSGLRSGIVMGDDVAHVFHLTQIRGTSDKSPFLRPINHVEQCAFGLQLYPVQTAK